MKMCPAFINKFFVVHVHVAMFFFLHTPGCSFPDSGWHVHGDHVRRSGENLVA